MSFNLGGRLSLDAGDFKRSAKEASKSIEDVDKDPVIIFDGLTKNWRYPGFRISWTVGPRKVIDAVASAGSFLDGGGSRPARCWSCLERFGGLVAGSW